MVVPAKNDIAIMWFRNDLRLADNPALLAACKHPSLLPIFIWSPDEEGDWAPGAASRWWLHRALVDLDQRLRTMGSFLYVAEGRSQDVLLRLVAEYGADAVYWNRRYEPAIIARDSLIKKSLITAGTNVETCNGSCLFEPWEVLKKDGSPYQVYTAFWNAIKKKENVRAPLASPSLPRPPDAGCSSTSIDALALNPKLPWDGGLVAKWRPGEDAGLEVLEHFVADGLALYKENRDVPSEPGTSLISPYLHFGHLSPVQAWHKILAKFGSFHGLDAHGEQYLKELVWRDFAINLIFYYPHTTTKPLREQFANFPWVKSKRQLSAWQGGLTGYPIVDAGMRELWHTGWMHNRVRMIVASFLVKDLRISWLEGARWFWDTLVDADLASNTMGWQWAGGCGADAAPYFRVFNPTLQGQRFDPEGHYVRKWLPELAHLPNDWLHKPWEAQPGILGAAGVVLGKTYPKPIVDHGLAKMEALMAYDSIKSKKIPPPLDFGR